MLNVLVFKVPVTPIFRVEKRRVTAQDDEVLVSHPKSSLAFHVIVMVNFCILLVNSILELVVFNCQIWHCRESLLERWCC
jgi:hypothetical protein